MTSARYVRHACLAVADSMKLIASIITISAIHLLCAFMEIETVDEPSVRWMVIIRLCFVISGVLLALMDWITERSEYR